MNKTGSDHEARSMPEATSGNPRLPKLAEVPAFQTLMASGWSEPDRTPHVEPGAAEAAAAHRVRLSDAMVDATVVVPAGRAPVRNNDCNFLFRPSSDFYWLTACDAEDAVLVLYPRAGGHDAVLYLSDPHYPGDTGFFADARNGELWVGSAPSPADWSAALDLKAVSRSQLEEDLAGVSKVLATDACGSQQPGLDDLEVSADLQRVLAELRMVKDAWEVAELRKAVDETVRGFASMVRVIPDAVRRGGERWLQGTFERHARTFGNGPGYLTIVGGGPHAAVLHWTRADGPITPGDVVLADMGVEARSYYTADVTRTFPVSGRFTPAQRQIHDLVEAAHRAGIAAAQPGRPFTDFHHAAMEVLAQGLHDWGLLPVSVDEALSDQGQQHRRYVVCGIGHHLGLDVHDCSRSSHEAYQGATLAPNMVFTIEPGLYFHTFDQTVPPELRGLGVRIEDDLVVTPSGSVVLSDALPIDAPGIEAWVAAQQQTAREAPQSRQQVEGVYQ